VGRWGGVFMVIREQGGLPPILPLLFSVTGLRGWLRRCLFTPPVKSPVAFVSPVRPSVRPSVQSVRLSVRLSTASLSGSPRTPLSCPPFSRSRDIVDSATRDHRGGCSPSGGGGRKGAQTIPLSATRSYGNARWRERAVRLRFLLG